ncbi:MAG TPA: phosphoribosylanthranilate isomerase [Candidatus Acidoferrum sp.]|nr:phosphoribosylanthranilate isomerase [Candidatus Acidoferrum sp.]
MFIKVCGLTCKEDLCKTVKFDVDAVGFIVDVPVRTPRKVSVFLARDLIGLAKDYGVQTAAVIMPEDAYMALKLSHALDPDYLQIHCVMPYAEQKRIYEESGSKVITVMNADARANYDYTDYVLVDKDARNSPPSIEFSQNLVKECKKPVLVAGNLTPANVSYVIENVKPFGVDVASGVEKEGKKDASLIGSFVKSAREAACFV